MKSFELLPNNYFRNRSVFEDLDKKQSSIILTEDEFNSLVLNLVTESLAIAEEVENASNDILYHIKKSLRKTNSHYPINEGNFRWRIFNNVFDIIWTLYNVDKLEKEEWPNQIGAYVDYDNEEIKLDIVQIGGEIDTISLKNSLQHEIEHIYQRYKRPDHSNFKIKDKNLYDKALELLKSDNKIKQEIGRAVYLMFTFEQDAFVNGLYAAMKENDGTYSFKDIWDRNDAKIHLNFLIQFNNKLYEEIYCSDLSVQEALSYLNRSIIWLRNHTNKAIKRFARKIELVKRKLREQS